MKGTFTLFILSEFSNIQQFDTKFINIDYITIKNFFKNNIYSLQNINKNAALEAGDICVQVISFTARHTF